MMGRAIYHDDIECYFFLARHDAISGIYRFTKLEKGSC